MHPRKGSVPAYSLRSPMHTGLDRLADSPDLVAKLRGARFGLLAHPASVARDLTHISDVLARLGLEPKIVFGPEHGYGGEAQDMIGVADAKDARGVSIRSLYGDRVEDLSPHPADLADLDWLVIDLQDVGARYYTFVWTAVLALRACAKSGVRVLALDRPNPLGHGEDAIEGRAHDPAFSSFVGLVPVPIRHGLTMGGVLAWRAEAEGLAQALEVVGVRGIDPALHAPSWDRAFVMPSPNMPTYATALVYPGGCLLEGTNLSEGRGTTRPFEITGAPWLDGPRLARDLNALRLPGFSARPLTFLPMFQKHAKHTCGGVQIHVTDPLAFRPVLTYVALIALAHRQDPALFRFRTERYEFVDDIPAFDLLTGDARARKAILAGGEPLAVAHAVADVGRADSEIVRESRAALQRFSL
jgi:uncharacterized protein YbbC (DUF1343 family)